ncbi:hypothetical protein [Filimonas effusa]|uniref:GAF domain-containing protein n=1 Tax=Filimonas effusa TaxID=2508721 RepID=A0A4Q1DBX2_9BACT|nr:hypothetical protein [Filimonas effusa]RXK86971.1 hypothetical protein ESB13_09360 [Filimonas effusa]
MVNWEQVAIRFANQTGTWEHDNDIAGFLPYSIGILRKISGAYLSLRVVIEDDAVSRVKDANPSFMNGMVLDSKAVLELLREHQYKVICWKTIPEKHNLFSDILQALSTAVIIPVKKRDTYHIVILGWMEPQSFNDFFDDAALLIQKRMQEILAQSKADQELQQRAGHMLAVLRTLPYSLVYIDDDSTASGWANRRATALLQLKEFGFQEPGILPEALEKLREQAINKEQLRIEMSQRLSSSSSKVENWIWSLGSPLNITLAVTCMPVVEQDIIKGRLWIIREETAV